MMTDDRRRRLRRILMWGFVPFALAGAVVSTKLVSVNAFSDAAVSAFDRRSWNEAEQQARGLEWWNWIETWKAPFDIAVAMGMRGEEGDLEEARALLEHALELQGDPESNDYCIILTNIVYVVEKQGDAAREADDTETANGLYEEALGIIDEAPEGCFEEPQQGEANTQEQLEASVPRIEDKIEEESGGGEDGEEDESDGGEDGEESEGDESEGEESEDESGGSQEDQLEEQNQDAQGDQQAENEYYDQQEEGEDGEGGGVDQPW